MSTAFADQVVWITGASSGIGEALARAFAVAGARVVLSARRETELQRVAATLAGGAEHHIVLPLDLTATDTFPAAVATVTARCGHIDLLINNGGLGQRGFAVDTPLEIDRRIMEVNYFGQVGLTKAVLPGMIARGAGRVVVISSVVGYVATPRRSAYAASKHALHGFFNALRAEVHATGVRVTLVCPGYVRTEISVHALDSTGGRHAKMDTTQANAMSADVFAARLLSQIAAGRDEIHIGGREVWAVRLQRWLPRLTARILRRAKFS
ncbi:SDR family oxidoreductase [Synoicihabitans lomoniglobus]|uniref:SDR family oxidoreductase n=1 Tax=Synoicihabitans lomoniglobus TaxID=2909285 RepID=A0AAE9ZW41_9BACT|nr:SDR family oxidoreductase [Opitutaceae bacterium LMO-M01]WED63578.1 SDR family oxidoreductase [Opitutaceae bacterium LMO-M01]